MGDITVANNIGIGTLAPIAPLQIGSGDASTVISASGVGIGTTELGFGIGLNAFQSSALFNGVGVGTADPISVADFSCIGAHNVVDDERFLRLPVVNNTQRGQIDDIGAMVANSSTNQIQVYDGADWRRLDTQNSQGITTATGGFTSGTGGPVQISVVGSTLTFTVNGVGSTSLTLS